MVCDTGKLDQKESRNQYYQHLINSKSSRHSYNTNIWFVRRSFYKCSFRLCIKIKFKSGAYVESISIFGMGLSELALVAIAALMIMGPKGISSIKPFLKVAYKSYLGFMHEVNSMQGSMEEMKSTVMEPIKEIQDEAEKELKGIEKDVMPDKATSDFIKNEVKRMMEKSKAEMAEVNKEVNPNKQMQKGAQQIPSMGARSQSPIPGRPQIGGQNRFAGQMQSSSMQKSQAQTTKAREIQKDTFVLQASEVTNIKPPEFKIPEIKPPEFNPPTEEEIEKSVIALETSTKAERKAPKKENAKRKTAPEAKISKPKAKLKEKEKAKGKTESKKGGSKKRR